MTTCEYAPGRSADRYGEPDHPTVLLWHGMQTDSRAAVGPLAERLAARGFAVVAADWDSHADDLGRADLLASARFAAGQPGAADGLIVVGWSMGGAAAIGLTLAAAQHGVRVARAVCLGGAFTAPDPFAGGRLIVAPPSGDRTPITLVHGASDDVVPPRVSRDFAATLGGAGWAVQYLEIAADHGNIVGARFDAAADRYEPADDADSLAVADSVAALIAGTGDGDR
ncbi:alpha/beta fold hydrolase [Mycobacterium sp. PS03-16]|uniref:alpha/beta hydrolase family protein n=1 Tax=Mycobacterium sp. PS03-16 TaxID=2559611 RepID=UPI00107422D7|nr:alpha/beta fold hydrolase [Mycobacterium sp. PS03-16]TFV59346.1 alpha/beta fold hydrolase [Mycobacterium sp. PS03-16]